MELAIRYSYSEKLLLKFKDRFLEEYRDFIDRLNLCNEDEVFKLVHKLKGITLNLGAEELYNKCLLLENTKDYNNDYLVFIDVFKKSYQELLDS